MAEAIDEAVGGMDGLVQDGWASSAMNDDVDDRQSRQRDSLYLGATLHLAGERERRSVRVRNLSESGAMVQIDRDVPVGTRLELDLRNIGPVAGQVVWAVAGRIGVALDRAIDPRRARLPVGGSGQAAPHR